MNTVLKPIIISIVAALAGCSVTHEGVTTRANELEATMSDQLTKKRGTFMPEAKPLYKRIPAVWIGSKSTPIARNLVLPKSVSDISFLLPRRTNLQTAAKHISALTKYPVRINPDVYINPRAIVPAMDASVASPSKDGTKEFATNMLSAQLPDGDTTLQTDFEGPLESYLDTICAHLNINWEFTETKGFYFYRLVTRLMEVKLHGSSDSFTANATKGASASTGTTGSASGSSSGAYTSQITSTTTSNYSPWAALEAAINAVKSPLGRVAVDISSNNIVARDLRESVEEMERIVQRANEVHSRQITLTLRTMRISYSDSSATSIDVQGVYAKLLAGGGIDTRFTLKSPGSLVSSDSGGLGIGILSPTSRWQNSTALVQAVNQLGKLVSDTTKSVVTMNRRTLTIGGFDSEGYLAETTPAQGGALSGGGVPGLKTAQLTTGSFLQMTPTSFDDGTVWIEMNTDESEKRGPFRTIAAGEGSTFQQVQLTNTHTDNKRNLVGVKAGESLLLVNISNDSTNHSTRTGVLGTSGSGERMRELQLMIITPYVRSL